MGNNIGRLQWGRAVCFSLSTGSIDINTLAKYHSPASDLKLSCVCVTNINMNALQGKYDLGLFSWERLFYIGLHKRSPDTTGWSFLTGAKTQQIHELVERRGPWHFFFSYLKWCQLSTAHAWRNTSCEWGQTISLESEARALIGAFLAQPSIPGAICHIMAQKLVSVTTQCR